MFFFIVNLRVNKLNSMFYLNNWDSRLSITFLFVNTTQFFNCKFECKLALGKNKSWKY